MPYRVSARAYAKRARHRLNEGTRDALFYAAFELRAGIEARMQEYLYAQESVAQSKKDAWQIKKLGQYLEEAFAIGDRIVQVVLVDEDKRELIDVLYYTPVTSELQHNGQRIGELLHAMAHFRADDDPWWRDTRAFLEGVSAALNVACTGTLLAPLLRDPKTNRVRIKSEILDETAGAKLRATLKQGFVALVNVNYLERLPKMNEPLSFG